MCTASIRDVAKQFTQPQPKRNPDGSLLIERHDAAGRPIGVGGERRNKKIMELVNQSQRLQIPE